MLHLPATERAPWFVAVRAGNRLGARRRIRTGYEEWESGRWGDGEDRNAIFCLPLSPSPLLPLLHTDPYSDRFHTSRITDDNEHLPGHRYWDFRHKDACH